MKQQKPISLVLCINNVRETRGVSEKSKLYGLSLIVKTDTKTELVEKNEARQKKRSRSSSASL